MSLITPDGLALFDLGIQRQHGYFSVVVTGTPDAERYVAFLHVLGLRASAWPIRRAMFDLRGVQTVFCAAQQHEIGIQLAASWSEFERLALLVQAGRDLSVEARSARRNGVDARLFDDAAAAHGWLSEDLVQLLEPHRGNRKSLVYRRNCFSP